MTNDYKYYKWSIGNDVYCAVVFSGRTATYYKNGKMYAPRQGWILRGDDIEITEKEFNEMLIADE